jgi:aspartyl-tRNA(Asn)/glutamyl-tRNA(Gln) amidotransferase subunit A
MFSISSRSTIKEIHNLYESKLATPSQVVRFFYNRISEVDKKILAFNELTTDFANKIATQQDKLLESKSWSEIVSMMPLFGIPFGNKAIIQVEGEIFNGGSKILQNYVTPYSSTAYLNIEKAGAIMLGICNMDSHAMGSSGENSDFGITRNPFDTTRICGGSSSGSAGSVASGQVVFSLGTDTGGSIRQPACFTDTVGLKPTYGMVSRWGTQPMASSLDQVGAFTNSVEDNISVTIALAGKDKKDMTSIDSSETVVKLKKILELKKSQRPQAKFTQTFNPLRIGIPKEFYIEGTDPVIANAISDIKNKLEQIGHTLVPLDLPIVDEALAIYYMTVSVEVSSNLQRIDGVRFAKQDFDAVNVKEEMYFDQRGGNFPEEAQRRIMLGSYASSAGYYEAYYNQSQKVRALAIDQFSKAFEQCDVMLVPTSPEFPFKIGEKTTDPIKMYLSDIFTCLINPIKIPGLNVPLGLFEHSDEGTKEIKIFDETTEEEKKLPAAPKRIRAVALINIAGTDKYLAFKKNLDTDEYYNDPNTVYLPGGKIEGEESVILAAQRETLEEIGVDNLEFVKVLGECEKVLRYQDSLSFSHETYILYTVNQSEVDNKIHSEIDTKNYTLEQVTLQELRNNNWSQLNWILDNMESKKVTVNLPTGCQILANQLGEDKIFQLALDIETLVKGG